MNASLAGKVAVVTGGSRGIGRAIVNRLSSQGAKVAFNYLRDSDSAERLVEEIAANGGEVLAIQADTAKVDEIDAMFKRIIEEYGRFDILVNNAGIATYKKIADFTEHDFDRLMDINLKGVFFCCRQAALHMADNGVIVNIGSTVTRVMLPTYGAYAASKGGVEQITKVLAKELGERNIRVNTLSPGPIDTELFRKGKSDEQIQELASMAALQRLGSVEDVADMVALLVDEQSGWLTGQNIPLNGGFAA